MSLGEAFEPALAAARNGEQWGWSAIYRDLAGPVQGYLASRGAADAEDSTSETFLQVARSLSSFSGDERQFRSWVFVIAHRRLIDERRASGRRVQAVSLDAEATPTMRIEDAARAADVEALDQLSAQDAAAMLAGLTDDQRDVLLLRIVGDLSVKEAAKVLGRSEGSTKVLQHRALAALRDRLRARS